MKFKRLLIIGAALLLSGCSLGAKTLSTSQLKSILEKEVLPTKVEDVAASGKNLSLKVEERNIEAKVLKETAYSVDARSYEKLTVKPEKDFSIKGSSMVAKKTVVDYVTKEIVNSAGVRTYTDVEKKVVEVTYKLDAKETTLDFLTIEDTSTIKTDYLSVETDVLTGKVSRADIVVDDNLFELEEGTKDVVYDTIESENGGEEDGDDTPEEYLESLKSTKWSLTDSNKVFKKAKLEFEDNLDTVASKNTKVGTLTYGTIKHDLFVFEKGDGYYNFEIRDIQETKTAEADQVKKSTNYDIAAADVIETTIKPTIAEFFAQAEVSEVANSIKDKYSDAITYIQNTVDGGDKKEILQRETGIAYRVIQADGLYKEVLLGKQDKDTNLRAVSRVTERQGLKGNDILTHTFSGF